MPTLRVLTLNIWNRQGPWEARKKLIGETLRRWDPDVVGLQEVIHRPGGSRETCQACTIADAWKREGLSERTFESFGAAFTYENGDQFGNAVVSKFPIAAFDTFALPTEDQRSLHFARIRTPFGSLPFFVTHFSWKFNEGIARELQALAVARQVDECCRPDDLPAIVVGDLNAAPDAQEIRYLRGLCSLSGTSTHFTDCYERVGTGPGYTFDPTVNPHASLTYEAPRRIDYILVKGPNDAGQGLPLSANVVADRVENESGQPYAPSDHFGVFSEIQY